MVRSSFRAYANDPLQASLKRPFTLRQSTSCPPLAYANFLNRGMRDLYGRTPMPASPSLTLQGIPLEEADADSLNANKMSRLRGREGVAECEGSVYSPTKTQTNLEHNRATAHFKRITMSYGSPNAREGCSRFTRFTHSRLIFRDWFLVHEFNPPLPGIIIGLQNRFSLDFFNSSNFHCIARNRYQGNSWGFQCFSNFAVLYLYQTKFLTRK